MHIIYIDDEKPALDNFEYTVANFPEITSLTMFQDGYEALEFVKNHPVDVVFCDMEMPEIHGIELAKKLREYDPDIRIIFVTAYGQYALDAWGVDATGYLLKPYTTSDIRKELNKCTYRHSSSHGVVIQTIPTFSISVDGKVIRISASKPKELLALLVDRGNSGVTTSEAISYLWPDRPDNANSQSLFRMTYKRLLDILEENGAGHIVASEGSLRFLKTDQVNCDLYHILAGDKQAAKNYGGQYLQEYSWAEERNGQLYWMLLGKEL